VRLRLAPLGTRHQLCVPRVAWRVLAHVDLRQTSASATALDAATADHAPASAAARHDEPRSHPPPLRLRFQRQPHRRRLLRR
jgi:hypothetical protein